MIVYPNAKINIGLNIIKKRSDGFHAIESCFFPIDLCDILEIVESDSNTSFQSTGISIPGDPDKNLCIKAWQLLNKNFNIPRVKIYLHKQIPIGAGLGGGSADGAFTLKSIAALFNLMLSTEQLEAYAAELGSDCAFFIKNKPAFAEGRGGIISELDVSLSNYRIVLINPGIHIGTAEAYAGITPKQPKIALQNLIKTDLKDWQEKVINDFEPGIFLKYPELDEIKNRLIGSGALFAAMTGSGSSIFGLFEENCMVELQKEFENMFYWEGKIIE